MVYGFAYEAQSAFISKEDQQSGYISVFCQDPGASLPTYMTISLLNKIL